jgi:hypothetical protein
LEKFKSSRIALVICDIVKKVGGWVAWKRDQGSASGGGFDVEVSRSVEKRVEKKDSSVWGVRM